MAVVKQVFPGRMLRFEPAAGGPDDALDLAEGDPSGYGDSDAEDLDARSDGGLDGPESED